MSGSAFSGARMLPSDLTPFIHQGHVLDVLRAMPEESVQCVVTSPPYWGLRAYGTEPQVWGGEPTHSHDWVPTSPRRQRDADDAGGALNKGNAGASHDAQGGYSCACGAWRGELGLEPTPELFVLHIGDVFDEVRRVLRKDGSLWLNLGDTYAASPPGNAPGTTKDSSGLSNSRENLEMRRAAQARKKDYRSLKPKDLVGIPWRVAFELQSRGWWLRSDCVWAKPNPMPESVTDRPTRSHEFVFLLTKSARYFYDADAVRTTYSPKTMPEIGEKYAGIATKAFRQYRAQDSSEAKRSMIRSLEKNPGANLKSVWWIPTQPYPEAHFATFPEALVETCLRAGTSENGSCPSCGAASVRKTERPPVPTERVALPKQAIAPDGVRNKMGFGNYPGWRKDPYFTEPVKTVGWVPSCDCHSSAGSNACLVLDPFAGSGTVLSVARSMGLRSVGIELKPEYVDQARKRSQYDVPDLERFSAPAAGVSARPT